MHTTVKLLVGLLVLAAVVAGVEISHPKGVRGVFADLTGRHGSAPSPVRQGTAAPEKPPAKAAEPPTQFWGPGAAKQLSWGDRDYDRGDFDGAVANYGSSRLLAADEDERRRATQGLERALLAAALVKAAPPTVGTPSELTAQATQKISAAEAQASEKTWLETVRWLAGAGQKERLPYAVGQALDLARPGGFVQGALEDALRTANHRHDDLAGAMASRGLGSGPPLASMPVLGPHEVAKPGTTGKAPNPKATAVNDPGVPSGHYSAAMREQLRKAVRLEGQGTIAYRAAGPDSPSRVDHRHTAIDCLKQARDIYQAAIEEEPNSPDLDARLRNVMLMLAQLRKDEAVGGLR